MQESEKVAGQTTAAAPVIETTDLSFRFGNVDILQELSLQIPRGSICGVLGRNGCGKTTLLRLLIGMYSPYQGASRVLGMDPLLDSVEIRRRTGFMPQESDYDRDMTVQGMIDFIRPFYGERWNEEILQRQLERFDLASFAAEMPIHFLSSGLRQRLALAITLAPEPELLVLDEPTAGLDALVRRDFAEAIVEYMSVPGRTVVLASHLLNELERLVDHVIFLEDGRQLLAAPLDELKERLVRIEATLPEGADMIDLPELLSCYCRGDTLCVSLWQDDDDRLQDVKGRLEAAGLDYIEVADSSLDSMFVDLLGE